MSDTIGGPTTALFGGIDMPLLGLGTWLSEGEECYTAVRDALDIGYRHIDTATMYANEADIGRAISDSGIPRSDIFITTKLPPQRVGRERQTIEESLNLLGVDYLDLWLVHWPPRGRASIDTWEEFLAAQRDGLVRSIGVSNFSIGQIDELIDATGQPPAVNQIPWGPALFDEALVRELGDRNIVLEGYSPLKNTDLNDPILTQIAKNHEATPAQVVLRWHIDHGFVVIPKSVHPERLRQNFDILDFSLDAEELRDIDSLSSV